MGRKKESLLLTVVMLVLAFDCGNCNTQDIGKVLSIRSNAVVRVEDSESVLHRDSRSVHRSRRSILNSTEIQEAIDTHNRVRRWEGSSNMEIMIWDADLASIAERSANSCSWNHSNTGDNLYATNYQGPINLTEAILAWYKLGKYYYITKQCSPPNEPCLHYSQVVWATSRKLGCAYTRCLEKWENTLFLVCNYDPPGNKVIGEKPNQNGTACSRCATGSWWCNEGLCDRSCTTKGPKCGCHPVCRNNGTANTATCSCSCAPEWRGSDCSVVCKDIDSNCDPQEEHQGWTPSSCTDSNYGPKVREKCPKMCEQCQECALMCLNNGTLNSATCSCSCAPGWYGIDCSVVCENKDPLCDPKQGQDGYTRDYCTRIGDGPKVREKCPKMCNQCKVVCRDNDSRCYQKPGETDGWPPSYCSHLEIGPTVREKCPAMCNECQECATSCQNSGSMNSDKCSCSCAPGWQGTDCSVVCKDFDSKCDPQSGEYGWPPSYCSHREYGAATGKFCPAMCKLCQGTESDVGNSRNFSTSTKTSLLSILAAWLFRYSFSLENI